MKTPTAVHDGRLAMLLLDDSKAGSPIRSSCVRCFEACRQSCRAVPHSKLNNPRSTVARHGRTNATVWQGSSWLDSTDISRCLCIYLHLGVRKCVFAFFGLHRLEPHGHIHVHSFCVKKKHVHMSCIHPTQQCLATAVYLYIHVNCRLSAGDAQEPAVEAGGHRDCARGAGREVRHGGAGVAVRGGPGGGHGRDVRHLLGALLFGGLQAG